MGGRGSSELLPFATRHSPSEEVEILVLLPGGRLVARFLAVLERALVACPFAAFEGDEVVDKNIAECAAEQRLLVERVKRLGQAFRQQRPLGGVRSVLGRRRREL